MPDKVPRDTENNADPALNLLADTVIIKTAQSSLNEEVALVAVLAIQMAGFTADLTNSPFTNTDISPYIVFKQAVDLIALACGRMPNVLAVSQPVWTAIRTHPQVVGLITGAPRVENARVSLE